MLRSSLALVLALSACAGAPPSTKPAQLVQVAAPVAAPLVVALETEDMTRKESKLDTMVREELTSRGISIRPTKIVGGYVVHVRVDARNSDHSLSRDKPAVPKGSNRLDGAVDAQQDEAYRETPAPETGIYSAPTRPGRPVVPTDAVDDFRVAASATITRRGSDAVLASAQFDEREMGISPVAASDRKAQWDAIYRGIAMHVATWVQKQKLP